MKHRKAIKNLQARQSSHDAIMAKPRNRGAQFDGGYTRPGSMNGKKSPGGSTGRRR